MNFMCGVAGQYNFDARSHVNPGELRRVIERLRHRGPESVGIWTDGHVGFSHARLKVVDPEHGIQPMRGAGGSVLAYVGELYNNTELRAELAVRGYPFTTTCDTEVLLAAFETWGEGAWERLNGMFAFALCDRDRRHVYLVRDRFGVKPLYYREQGGSLEFSSESAGWTGELQQLEPSKFGVLRYLRFNHLTAGTQTLFENINALPPGQLLKISQTSVELSRWHQREQVTENAPDNVIDLRAKLRHLLHLSVGRQIVADSEVGVMLSGGLDSAIITGIYSQLQPRPVRTFAIALEGDEADLNAARLVAHRFRTEHTEIRVSFEDFFRGYDELLELRKLPVSLPNEVLIYLLSKRAARDVKVLLSGEGADELFGGYSLVLDRMQRYAHARDRARQGDELMLNLLHKELPDCNFESEARFFESCSSWMSAAQLRELLHPEWLPALEEFEATEHVARSLEEAREASPSQPCNELLLSYHLPQLLNRLDGASMAASIEGRVPFMDNDIVNFARALPVEQKFTRGGSGKRILRESYQDLLGDQIAARPKRAFHASPELLFSSQIGQKYYKNSVANAQRLNFLNSDRALRLLNGNGGQRDYLAVWLLCGLTAWMNRNQM